MPIVQSFPLPVLIADIGGTNARFALIEQHERAPRPLGTVRTSDFADFPTAARTMLANAKAPSPRTLMVDGAGPVVGNEIKLTNANWRLVIDDIGRDLGVEVAMLLNDFEALSLSLPFLPSSGMRQVGRQVPGRFGAKVVVGPGTGLGATTLIEVNNTFVPVPSECGMSDIGPVTAAEEDIWPHLDRHVGEPPEGHVARGRIYAEWLLSGSGLERIYQGICRQQDKPLPAISAAAIGEAANAGSDPMATAAVDLFLGLLARYSGDLALIVKATGGVYLAGGVVQRLAALLDEVEFRKRFEAKSPLDGLMRTIATSLVTLDVPAFIGLAAYARAPDRFHLTLDQRFWQR